VMLILRVSEGKRPEMMVATIRGEEFDCKHSTTVPSSNTAAATGSRATVARGGSRPTQVMIEGAVEGGSPPGAGSRRQPDGPGADSPNCSERQERNGMGPGNRRPPEAGQFGTRAAVVPKTQGIDGPHRARPERDNDGRWRETSANRHVRGRS